MGSAHNKDEHVDMYIEVHRPYYVAGDAVEGCIYLHAKTNRDYQDLSIRLKGHEHIEWLYDNNQTDIHLNDFENYDGCFPIRDFNGSL